MTPLLLTWLCVAVGFTAACILEPNERVSSALRTPGDNGFRLVISGEPESYVPQSVYTLSLVGSRTHGLLQQFSRFTLTVAPADGRGVASPQRVGSFLLFGDSIATFNEECVNTVSEVDDLPKTEVQIMWTSPPKGSGCVTFRAMVLENADNWYADEGALNKELCELALPNKQRDGEETQACCSCDEAKYKLVFEGIWSNRTHPKDFPFSLWLTHFSDVIGASHEQNFSFWGEGQLASDGLQQVAEWGSVRGLEVELRSQSKHLRTIIKAAGLWYPRVNTNTTSSFRVDQRRPHLSVVSMFGPSPDWIVGVSGLNLCLADCTWVESKVIDLFPWDAGTDNGITYMSPNSPTTPPERIHRITTLYPEDPRAPFYDSSSTPMQPMARLYLTREGVEVRECGDHQQQSQVAEVYVAENTEDTSRPECAVTEYTPWSACSVSCGKGLRMRQRNYAMPEKAAMLDCNRQLVSKEMCVAAQPSCSGDLDEPIEDLSGVCRTSDWGPLSECSVTCGVGMAMRIRRFMVQAGFKHCPHVHLVEKEKCMMLPCTSLTALPTEDPMCSATEWNDWSPCSASCGKGVKFRTRLLLVSAELQEKCGSRMELMQQRPCQDQAECGFDMATAKQVCMLEPEIGPCRGYYERWHFDIGQGSCQRFGFGGCRGNRNNFLTEAECVDACGFLTGEAQRTPAKPPVDCVVSNWSVWTDCSVSCGVGIKERFRMVKVQPVNEGRPCPKRLVRRKKCQIQSCSYVTDNKLKVVGSVS